MAGRRGVGVANREDLSLSWQGVTGGDLDEVRFVVGIHFPWVSQGNMGLDVGNSVGWVARLLGLTLQFSQPSCGHRSKPLYF